MAHYREGIVHCLLDIELVDDGRIFVEQAGRKTPKTAPNGHYLEEIPLPENYEKPLLFLKCRKCTRDNKRNGKLPPFG